MVVNQNQHQFYLAGREPGRDRSLCPIDVYSGTPDRRDLAGAALDQSVCSQDRMIPYLRFKPS